MIQRIIATTRPHYDSIARLSVRDTEIMACSVALMCGLCWHVGHPWIAAFVALCILCTETTFRLMFARKWRFRSLSRVRVILTAMGLHAINAVLYAVPAVYLANDPSFAIKIAGLIFVMGIQVYVANAWSGIPVFVYVLLVPSFVMLGITFLTLAQTDAAPSSLTHWAIATVVLILFIYSAIDTLQQHLETQNSLFAARADADQRLAQLEDSDRRDTLTGLLHRRAFDDALAVMLADREGNGGEIAVFLVDLNSFKPINDTYTHEAGDAVLLHIAKRLRAHVGDDGIVARMGGDEFICAVGHLHGVTEAMQYAVNMSGALSGSIEWNARTLKIGASIGIAMTGHDAAAPPATVSALCSAADQAMFAAKSSPNGAPVLYQRHVFASRMSAQDKQTVIEGITSGAVGPHYQPKVHLHTGEIIGFEALARWDHPGGGLRQPSEFLNHINDMGLQGDFMVALVKRVIADIEAMHAQSLDPGQVSLNIPEVALATHSGRRDLEQLILTHREAARHLTFEITEDVFIARAADTIQASIASFRAKGVRISLDDFGTGFASFHHLRELDFDELKIDTSFIAGLGHDPTSEVLVRGFLSIASGLGVSVIAEGVETQDQRRDLMNMGCIVAQGYLFSEAVPVATAMKLLKDQRPA